MKELSYKALLFCAGLGTRLHPLTANKPKALVEINKKTLLEIALIKLQHAGIKNIVINVHHYADQIINFLKENNNFGLNITVSDERDMLLDTGGGLKKASWFFNDDNPFLIYNVDIISDIDLKKLFEFHIQSKSIATLAVRNRKSNRYLLFNEENILCGWKNVKTKEEIIVHPNSADLNEFAFSGIQVLSPDIFKFIPEQNKFSIIDLYLRAALDKTIVAFPHNETAWFDVGNKEKLIEAEQYLRDQKSKSIPS